MPTTFYEKNFNTLVLLADRRGRILWTNQFPGTPDVWYYQEPIFAYIHPEDVEIVERAFSKCVIRGEMVDLSCRSLFPDSAETKSERYVTWRSRYYPADQHSTPYLAAVIVTHIVPDGVSLNDSDHEVLKGLMDDKSIKEIAEMLEKSQSTIETRIKNMKDKLGVETLPGLVASAMKSYMV